MKRKKRNSLILVTLLTLILQLCAFGPLSSPASAVLTCAQGGICVLGDTGPGGGIVFYVSTTPFDCGPTRIKKCDYLEFGNLNSYRGLGQSPTVNFRTTLIGSRAQNVAIGSGYQNTLAWIEQNGPYDAVSNAYDSGYIQRLRIGDLSDWYLPSTNEMVELYSYARQPLSPLSFLLNGFFNTSTEISATHLKGLFFAATPTRAPQDNGKHQSGNNRLAAIRSFSPLTEAEFAAAAAAAARAAEIAATPTAAEIAAAEAAAAKAAAEAAAIARAAEIAAAQNSLATALRANRAGTLSEYRAATINITTDAGLTRLNAEVLKLSANDRADFAKIKAIADKIEFDESFFNATARPTLATYSIYGVTGVTERILAVVNAKVLELPAALRADIKAMQELVNAESFIDRVANPATRSSVSAATLVTKGLLPADSPYKFSVVQGLASYPEGSLNSMAKIEAAVKEQIEKAEAPKRRLAQIKAKIAARRK